MITMQRPLRHYIFTISSLYLACWCAGLHSKSIAFSFSEIAPVIIPYSNDTIPDTLTSSEMLRQFITGDTTNYTPTVIVFIQFGAFESEEKAKVLEAQLINKYQGVYILDEYNESLEKYLYKVVIGPVDEYALLNISKRLDRDNISYWTKPVGNRQP